MARAELIQSIERKWRPRRSMGVVRIRALKWEGMAKVMDVERE